MTETVVSSATREVVIGFERPFCIIGERINPTGRKKLAAEMIEGNFDTVIKDALEQVAAGATMLDINAGVTSVNPNETEVFGSRAYPSLRDLPEPPEVVNVFRRPEFVAQVVDEAIAAGAKAIWLQLGVIDYEAARRAREAGLVVVMDKCIMVEHRRSGL